MTEVLLSARARDRLTSLETDAQDRIKDALREINPQRDLAWLSGEGAYKFRVGDYRVIIAGPERRHRIRLDAWPQAQYLR